MQIKFHHSINDFSSGEWDALVENNYPFLKHAFLAALEHNRCVDLRHGWVPYHLSCTLDDRLVGAIPLYLKTNSWGEFVFDYAWADAYRRCGINYYPKLVSSIPFTPAGGQRLLTVNSLRTDIVEAMLDKIKHELERINGSGFHCLFPSAADFELLRRDGFFVRSDCQFHWHNHGYHNFDDFLGTLRAKKRKNIHQERRRAAQSGVRISCLTGTQSNTQDWFEFARLYTKIYQRKWGQPALNAGFFNDIARDLGDQVILLRASQNDQVIAAALFLRDDSTLYGRHWGCENFVDALHFEVCYYQGIEMCIDSGLDWFNPGAQGEHKLARGFLPTQTRSLHSLRSSPVLPAIKRFCRDEMAAVEYAISSMLVNSPYRRVQ